MASANLSSLVAFLQEKEFLSKNQIEKVSGNRQFSDVPGFIRELVRREWITPYQAGQLAAGNEKELVFGPYHLLEPIGEGGMGKVFKARHVRMDIGFPPFCGGLLRWADSLGMSKVLGKLKCYEKLGPRFHPTEQMRQLAAAGKKFFA